MMKRFWWCLIPLVAAGAFLALRQKEAAPPPPYQLVDGGFFAEFSGERAYSNVQAQVDFGPRPAGSAALERCRLWMEEQLTTAGWQTERQTFEDETPNGTIEFANIRARFGTADDSSVWESPRWLIVGSHFDTKWYSSMRFVGANDGGSSTGILLELARVAAAHPEFARHIELVFFDGEEAFKNYTATDGLYGSRHYVQHYLRDPGNRHQRPGAMVLLDLVGERDLNVELPSDTPEALSNELFAAADEVGTREYFTVGDRRITDDHVPFQMEGIPAIDIIDLDYRAWHTSRDTMTQIDEKSLEIVGRTTLRFLERLLAGEGP